MYTLMVKDQVRKDIVFKSIAEMRALYTNSKPELIPIYRETKSIPIHPKFFSDYLPDEFDEALSEELYQLLMNTHLIDKKTGEILRDPRKNSKWREIVSEASFFPKLHDTIIPDQSPLSEIMNLAFGYHELTAEYAQDFVRFFYLYCRQ